MSASTREVVICTVRGCAQPLAREEAALRCAQGHSFDIAREGYCNLLQPQDRRSPRPGDSAEAVRARGRWLARGFADGLVAELRRMVAGIDASVPQVAVDVGCGDGSLGVRVRPDGWALVGIDIATPAVQAAARAESGATWVVANADRMIPLASGSCGLALSLFGRRPWSELARVLAPGGRLVIAVPGPDDLAELRGAVLGEARDLALPDDLEAMTGGAAEQVEDPETGLRFVARSAWRSRAHHDRGALLDLLAATYRAGRPSRSSALANLDAMVVTLSASLLSFERTR